MTHLRSIESDARDGDGLGCPTLSERDARAVSRWLERAAQEQERSMEAARRADKFDECLIAKGAVKVLYAAALAVGCAWRRP